MTAQELTGQGEDTRVDPRGQGGQPASSNAKDVQLECTVEKTGTRKAVVCEGNTRVTISGPRRVWLLVTVMSAPGQLTWTELIKADIENASTVLDRRQNARTSKGRPVAAPQMATSIATLQNLGNRIRANLGKLAYHWHQDGLGVVWSAACQ